LRRESSDEVNIASIFNMDGENFDPVLGQLDTLTRIGPVCELFGPSP
jgi:hypothetical protein